MIDSITPSGWDGSSTARTAVSTRDGEDEGAGTGTPLVIGWLQHPQITTPPVPAFNAQVTHSRHDFASALTAEPFDWHFGRKSLDRLLARLAVQEPLAA